MKNNFELNIDNLIIDGFSGQDEQNIRETLSKGLTEIVNKHGIPEVINSSHYEIKLIAREDSFERGKHQGLGEVIINSITRGNRENV